MVVRHSARSGKVVHGRQREKHNRKDVKGPPRKDKREDMQGCCSNDAYRGREFNARVVFFVGHQRCKDGQDAVEEDLPVLKELGLAHLELPSLSLYRTERNLLFEVVSKVRNEKKKVGGGEETEKE